MYLATLIIGWTLIAFAMVLVVLVMSFLVTAFFGAPFVASSRKNVQRMVALSGAREGMRIADIGSGDGRVLIALARVGAEAHGFEINPALVWYSRFRIQLAGLKEKAFVHRVDFRNRDLSRFDGVTVFGIDYMMPVLAEKCARELPMHAAIVSNGFSLPGWHKEERVGQVMRFTRQLD